MTSKSLCVIALSMAIGYASAEEISSAEARSYYQMKLEDKPEGVYEWDARDMIFVQVRVNKGGLKSVEKIESAEMGATKRVLRKWIEEKASRRRVDPVFPLGLNIVRQTCRKIKPSIEYAGAWRASGAGCSFSRETEDERITATVFRKSTLLESIPQGFTTPLSEETWLDWMKKIVRSEYDDGNVQRLTFECGALDCLCAKQKCEGEFPAFCSGNYASDVVSYFDKAMMPLRGTESISANEYDDVCKAVVGYLTDSSLAKRLLSDAILLESPQPKLNTWRTFKKESAVTNLVSKTSTNFFESVRCFTNATQVAAKMRNDGVALPLGLQYRQEVERTESGEEIRIITETIVREIRSTIGVDGVRKIGTPKFEKLFLGGGYLNNSPAPKTVAGSQAVKVFYGNASMEERENALLGAIRENPSDKELWNLLGRVYATKNLSYASIVCYRNALRIDAQYDFAITNLAIEYAKLGKKSLACGMAIIAFGLTDDAWCKKQAYGILNKDW